MRYVLALLVVISLQGCAGKSVVKFFDESGNVVKEISGAVVQRDALYLERGMHRDTSYKDMYKLSGVQIENEMVDINGTLAYLPKTIKVRQPPHFQQGIETRPPDHRVWGTIDRLLDKGLLAWVGYLVGDAYTNRPATYRYQGDYVTNSHNPYTVSTSENTNESTTTNTSTPESE